MIETNQTLVRRIVDQVNVSDDGEMVTADHLPNGETAVGVSQDELESAEPRRHA
jgi:hypothetical protein